MYGVECKGAVLAEQLSLNCDSLPCGGLLIGLFRAASGAVPGELPICQVRPSHHLTFSNVVLSTQFDHQEGGKAELLLPPWAD